MTLQRAYSLIQIKSVNEEKREITGIASTPTPDRYSDILEPEGAQFTLPTPFLWQHRHSKPIGQVSEATVTAGGIFVRAGLVIPTPDMPQEMVDRLNEAWSSIKTGLVGGLSVGFNPIEWAWLDNGGIHYLKWEMIELSAVTVAANSECTIQTIKSLDQKILAASGQRKPVVKSSLPAGVAAPKQTIIKGNSMDIAEQIKSFEAKRAALDAGLSTIMEKAAGEGRTLDASEEEQYEQQSSEVAAVDAHLKRLYEMEARQAKSAKPVISAGAGTVTIVDNARAPGIIHVEKKLEPGIGFARFAKCMAVARGSRSDALDLAKTYYHDDAKLQHVIKAAVPGATTGNASWAGTLHEYQEYASDFIDFLRPKTILGKFGKDGIPSLNEVPFNIKVPMETAVGSASWVGEGKGAPLTQFGYGYASLPWAKVVALTVMSSEMMSFSSPSVDKLVRNSMANTIIERLDTDFIDPTKAEVSSTSPGSITHGITAIASSGDPTTDGKAALKSLVDSDLQPTGAVWIMSASNALELSTRTNALGQKEFPDMTMIGGKFLGLPAIVTQYAGSLLVLLDAPNIYIADDGEITIDASREASLEMSDAPAQSSGSGTGAQMVSMYQTDSTALRAMRWVYWKRRRTAAVAYITGANYSTATPST
ncbi:phage major capsid protein [Salmonella enterica]|nr:phage major capsid protein [Salmonella enterica]EJI5362914.1 phage major capsid protein [Salmonella enterica]